MLIDFNQLSENEIEVSKNTDSIYNLTSMECMDSPAEIVDLVYGNKPQTNLKSESFCYTPQSYLNHLQCNNNVSDMTWYVIILEIQFHIHSHFNVWFRHRFFIFIIGAIPNPKKPTLDAHNQILKLTYSKVVVMSSLMQG